MYAHIFGPRRVDERRAPPSRSQRGQHGDRGGGGESHSRGAGGVHRKMLGVFRVFLGVRVLAFGGGLFVFWRRSAIFFVLYSFFLMELSKTEDCRPIFRAVQ